MDRHDETMLGLTCWCWLEDTLGGKMNAFLKVIILIGGTAISALIVLSWADPTFGTYLGEQVGFAVGFGSGMLIALSPILVFGFLVWILFFRNKK